MIYSVWNQGSRQYDYYAAGENDERANAPPPRHLRARPLGVPASEAAWPLPPKARPLGSGSHAKGRIAAPRRDLLSMVGLGDYRPSGLTVAIGLGIAALVLRRYYR